MKSGVIQIVLSLLRKLLNFFILYISIIYLIRHPRYDDNTTYPGGMKFEKVDEWKLGFYVGYGKCRFIAALFIA